MKLSSNQVRVAFAASVKEPLNRVWFGRRKIISSDVSVLAEIPCEFEGPFFGVEAKQILRMCNMELDATCCLEIEYEENTSLQGLVTLRGKRVENVPVECDDAVPKTLDGVPYVTNQRVELSKVTLNTDMLQKLIKICGPNQPVQFTVYEQDAPVKFECKTGVSGVIGRCNY